MDNFLYKDLSYKVIGLCMKTHSQYGKGHNERIYHKALEEKLVLSGIDFLSKPKVPIYSIDSGKEIGYYVPDLIIDNKLVVELKAYFKVVKSHEEQLFEYLKISEYEVGYLFNFKLNSLYFKRVIYTNNNKAFFSKIKKTD